MHLEPSDQTLSRFDVFPQGGLSLHLALFAGERNRKSKEKAAEKTAANDIKKMESMDFPSKS